MAKIASRASRVAPSPAVSRDRDDRCQPTAPSATTGGPHQPRPHGRERAASGRFPHRRLPPPAIATGFVLACALALRLAAPAAAAVLHVNTTEPDPDSGTCQEICGLADALEIANLTPGADTIFLAAGHYQLPAPGVGETSSLVSAPGTEVTLIGASADTTVLDAGGLGRVFEIGGAGLVRLTHLTLTGGDHPSAGGGLLVGGSAIAELDHCRVVDNQAPTGGGIAGQSGATLRLFQSLVEGNRADLGAGIGFEDSFAELAVFGSRILANQSSGQGGGIYASATDPSTLILRDTLIAENTAPTAGGTLAKNVLLVMSGVTFTGNQDGGLVLVASEGSIERSTFSDNTGPSSAELLVDDTSLLLAGSTLVAGENTPALLVTGHVEIAGSVVVGACATPQDGDIDSLGGNVETPADTCDLNVPEDHPNTDLGALGLAPLGDYGGPTPTHALLAGSVAIDVSEALPCQRGETGRDQRGQSPIDGDGDGLLGCDAGAYELQPTETDPPCAPSETTLCIDDRPGDRRFEVRLDFRTQSSPTPRAARTLALSPLGVDRGGLFYFFNPANPELLIKILNACQPQFGNQYWVFFSAGTNVELSMLVRDTFTDELRVYTNPLGNAAQPVQDLAAFPCD
jgi:hypothetical protein